MLRFSPRLLSLVALLWFASPRATAHAKDVHPPEAPVEVEAAPAEVAPPVEDASVPVSPSAPLPRPLHDTGCRPGDCPARDVTWAPSNLAPAPAATGRPPPGAIMRTTREARTQLAPPAPKRLPKLWPPIVLISIGGTLLVPGLIETTFSVIEGGGRSSGDGFALLILGGGLTGAGVAWLNRRRAKRRKILEQNQGFLSARGAGDHTGPRLSFGAHGLGASVRLQM